MVAWSQRGCEKGWLNRGWGSPGPGEKIELAQSCTELHRLAQSCTELHGLAQTCTELHRVAHSCTELHRLAKSCTELHRLAQSCTHCTNVLPAPCTACPLAPRIPYGDNHNHCSCIGNALLNAHMPKNFITNRAPTQRSP